jgi:hypothetical protein
MKTVSGARGAFGLAAAACAIATVAAAQPPGGIAPSHEAALANARAQDDAWRREVAAAKRIEVKLAPGIHAPPTGLEAPPARDYVAIVGTRLFPTTDTISEAAPGKLTPGQPVRLAAKVVGYDFGLVEENGVGVGYVPLVSLAPAGAR